MSSFSLERSFEILERTPLVLTTLLSDLSPEWIQANEGPDTWSPFDIVGHMIHGEKTDWMVRMDVILNTPDKPFAPFDRFAQFEASKGKTLTELLKEFEVLRSTSIQKLKSLNLSPRDFEKKGMHPALGQVTVQQLLATWVAHDLNHISQIARVMAKQYSDEVGPWRQYLGILN